MKDSKILDSSSLGLNRTAPLIGGAFVFLFVGLIYAWSIFVRPLEAEFGWTRAQTSGIFTLSISCFCLGGVAGGLISKKKSGRFIIRLAALLMLVGFLLSSRVESLMGIYISYGVFCGFGVGLAYNADISTVTKWYPDKMGFISGVLLMCFGFGGMVLGSAASTLITLIGWRTTFVVLGVAFALILTIASHFIVAPGPEVVLPQRQVKNVKAMEDGLSLTAGEMLRRPAFWLYFIWTTALTAAGLSVIGHAAVCAQDLGADVGVAALITGLISISNGCGRVLAGIIFDKFGRKFCVRLDNAVMSLAFIVLIASVSMGSIPVFILGGILMGLAYGGLPSSNSAFVNMFYGREHYPLNFSIINLNLLPAAFLGPLLAGAIKTATGSYSMVFIIMLAVSVVAYVVQLFVKKP